MSLNFVADEGIINKYINSADVDFNSQKLQDAIENALKKIDKGIDDFGMGFPDCASVNNVYGTVNNMSGGGWQYGFWTGMLWCAYELTGDEKYKCLAMKHNVLYLEKIEKKQGVNHHDMGFIYSPSCVAAYKLTGDSVARKAALLAADHLTTRYNEKGEFIQAWGELGEDNRLIVDCLMNIPLLYWASEESGDMKYHEMAHNHFRTTLKNTVRENAGSYQTYLFDKDTGCPIKGIRNQGFSDDTTWSRGQGWCIYGFMLTAKYTNDPDAVEVCKKMTNHYINRLPEDFVPYWDLDISGENEPRDSSAASVSVCGLIELVKLLPDSDPYKEIYKKVINATMNSLVEKYSTKNCEESNGLLLSATYSVPHGMGIDECNLWGDYFYMESLLRLKNPEWKCYW